MLAAVVVELNPIGGEGSEFGYGVMLFSPLSASAATRALNTAVRCFLFRFIGLILGVIYPSQTS
jgi:hypothetical protein